MGLDMYLTRKVYVKDWTDDNAYRVTVLHNGNPLDLDTKKITHVIEEAGYWRKANAIHKWFVDNVQSGVDDCKEYYVGRTDLQKLLDTCLQVLESPKQAQELLPTTNGFFFGNTDYDGGYLDDLNLTVEICRKALAGLDAVKHSSYYYQSSW